MIIQHPLVGAALAAMRSTRAPSRTIGWQFTFAPLGRIRIPSGSRCHFRIRFALARSINSIVPGYRMPSMVDCRLRMKHVAARHPTGSQWSHRKTCQQPSTACSLNPSKGNQFCNFAVPPARGRIAIVTNAGWDGGRKRRRRWAIAGRSLTAVTVAAAQDERRYSRTAKPCGLASGADVSWRSGGQLNRA